jgi:hypothetical protein
MYKNYKITKQAVVVYFRMLSYISQEVLRKTARNLIQGNQVSELRFEVWNSRKRVRGYN